MMEKLLQHNGWLKVFSLALAFLLWAMVIPSYTADITKVFDLPVAVKLHKDYPLVEGPDVQPPTYVQVRVEGKYLIVSRLTKEDFRAEVDYNEIPEPNKQVPVQVKVIGPPNLKATVSVTPKTFLATLVKTDSASFPVTVEPARGTVKDGGKEYQYTARVPEKVTLTGRTDLLSRVSKVRVPLEPGDLVPARSGVTKDVLALESSGKAIDQVHGRVDVALQWEELAPGTSFRVQPERKGAVPPGFEVVSMETEPSVLTLRPVSGTAKLPPVDLVRTIPIDLTGHKDSFETTVSLQTPPGVVSATETVVARVTIREQTMEKIFRSVPLKTAGQVSRGIVELPISTVQIRLVGPYSVVNPLDAGVVTAFVDVDGLTPGRHSVPVKVNQPGGVTSVQVDPAVVEVVVSAP